MRIETLFEEFLPPQIAEEMRWRGRLTIGVAWILALVGSVGLLLRLITAPLHPAVLAMALLVLATWTSVPWILRRSGSLRLSAALVPIGLTGILLAAAIFSGGIGAPAMALVPILPVITTALLGRRAGLISGAVLIPILLVFAFFHQTWDLPETHLLLTDVGARHARAVLLVVATIFATLIPWFYEEQTEGYRERLRDQERYYRRFVETSPIATYRCRPDGTMVDCNDAFVRLFRLESSDQINDLPNSLLLAETDDPDPSVYHERSVRAGQVSREIRFRRWDGETFWGLETINADLDDTSGRPLLEASIVDVTARKEKSLALARSEAALRASEARYRDLFDNCYDMIHSVRIDGTIEYANPAWRDRLGYSEEDLRRINIFDVIHPDDRDHCSAIFQRLYAGEEPEMIEARFLTRAGRTIRIEGRSSCKFIDGIPTASRGIFRDVTERREVEELKDQLVATVSHELRTPLTSISGALQVVRGRSQQRLSEKAERFLDIAQRNAERMMHLVNDLLSYQRIQAGMMTSELLRIDFDRQIRESIENNQGYAEAFQVGLRYRPDAPGARILADAGWLGQVVNNLVSNAVKFSPSDSTVEIATELLDESLVRLSVADRGCGIPEAFRARIFEPFSQARAAEANPSTQAQGSLRPRGTGLGLSICRALVEQMNGDVTFESTEGEGTVFYVTLPIIRREMETPLSAVVETDAG